MATKTLFNFFSSLPSPSPKSSPPSLFPPRFQSTPTGKEHLALSLLTLASENPCVSKPSLPYRCSVCHKAFSSHQALGGHKSSHRRPDRPAREARQSSSAGSSSGGSCGSGAHQCTLCFKRFPTGQALGGHKRLHYLETTALSSSSSISVNVRGFDLNLPPFLAQNEEEEVQSPLPRKKMRLSLLEL